LEIVRRTGRFPQLEYGMKKFLQNLLLFFSLALCGLIVIQWIRESKLRNDLKLVNEDLYKKKDNIQNLEASIKRVESEVTRLDKLRDELANKDKTNKLEIATITKAKDKLDREVEAQKTQIDAYKESVEKANAAIQQQNNDIKQQNGVIAQQNENIKRQNEEMKRLGEERNKAMVERNDAVKKQNDLVKTYNDLVEQVNKEHADAAEKSDKKSDKDKDKK
jgi:uncharacterized membrane protein YcjF (UPF0283 family)